MPGIIDTALDSDKALRKEALRHLLEKSLAKLFALAATKHKDTKEIHTQRLLVLKKATEIDKGLADCSRE